MAREVERYRLYVKGFDDNLGGGIPRGHIVLIAGETGSMKSSLAYHILFHNAKEQGVNGLYISLEQSKESLIGQMEGMGMEGDTLGRLEVLDLGRIRLKAEGPDWVDTLRFAISESKRKLNYELLVIDSLKAVEVMASFPKPREGMFRFFEWLRSLEITTLIISEMPVGPYSSYGSPEVDFLSDGIIYLSMVRVGDTDVQRMIRCVKMRGTEHSTAYFCLLRDRDRFTVTRAITEF